MIGGGQQNVCSVHTATCAEEKDLNPPPATTAGQKLHLAANYSRSNSASPPSAAAPPLDLTLHLHLAPFPATSPFVSFSGPASSFRSPPPPVQERPKVYRRTRIARSASRRRILGHRPLASPFQIEIVSKFEWTEQSFVAESFLMKREAPSQEAFTISSDDSDSESGSRNVAARRDLNWFLSKHDLSDEEILLRRAKMYQEYMRHMPIPLQRDSLVPCTSWQGLAKSLKKLHGQPLHYLTNILMREWDQQRAGSRDQDMPLDAIIHPSKAEALIWLTEEVHRLTCSHHYLAKAWALDTMYHSRIDSAASVSRQDVMLID